MSFNRIYGDEGQLIRYEMKKRGKRYYKKAIYEAVMPYVVSFVVFGALAVWFLINN